jgi:ribosomal protein S18 acetylase RimI-like enzyme
MLWISEEVRHQGWGRKLMEEAEKLGKERKCSFATVNTMDWEALTFYQKLGYTIEFIREGFEHHSIMYFLRKQL